MGRPKKAKGADSLLDDVKITFTVRMPKDLHSELRQLAFERHETQHATVLASVRAFLKTGRNMGPFGPLSKDERGYLQSCLEILRSPVEVRRLIMAPIYWWRQAGRLQR